MSILENFDLYAPRLVDKEEYFVHGHRACQGCAEALGIRLMCKALGKDTIIINATGCMEVVSSLYPTTAWTLPWLHVAFPNCAAAGSGVSSALQVLRRKGKIADRHVKAVCIGGDGGTFDIGLQALSGAMERGHDLLYICFDNEAYMNTGIQRSGATPFGAATTTHPAGSVSAGKSAWKKNITEIMVAHNLSYVATASPSYPIDFIQKVKKAKEIQGPAFIHCLAVCPTGWRCPSESAIKMGRLASETGVFPIFEIVDGKYRMTVTHEKRRPVEDYLKLQGRFRHLTPENVQQIQARVDQEYNKLMDKIDNLHNWTELKG